MKIIHERQKCIGCGACASLCPDYWEMGEDGKSRLKNSKVNPKTGNYELAVKEAACNKEAEDSCPVQCIHVEK